MNIHPSIAQMSIKEMEREIYDILTEQGMDEDEADAKVDSMDQDDMVRYLSEMHTILEEDK